MPFPCLPPNTPLPLHSKVTVADLAETTGTVLGHATPGSSLGALCPSPRRLYPLL